MGPEGCDIPKPEKQEHNAIELERLYRGLDIIEEKPEKQEFNPIDLERLYSDLDIVDVKSLYRRVELMEDQMKLIDLNLVYITKEVQKEFLRRTGGGVYATPELLSLTREAFAGLDGTNHDG